MKVTQLKSADTLCRSPAQLGAVGCPDAKREGGNQAGAQSPDHVSGAEEGEGGAGDSLGQHRGRGPPPRSGMSLALLLRSAANEKLPGQLLFEEFVSPEEEQQLVSFLDSSQPAWRSGNFNGPHRCASLPSRPPIVSDQALGALMAG